MLVSSAARYRLFASSGYMPAPCRDLLMTIDLSLKGPLQGKLPSLCRPSILPSLTLSLDGEFENWRLRPACSLPGTVNSQSKGRQENGDSQVLDKSILVSASAGLPGSE